MAWEEWERLKSTAVERHSMRMRLNQLPADRGGRGSAGGGATGTLRSDQAAWSAAGQGVGDLRDNIAKALAKLQEGQTGLTRGGSLTAAAQKSVHDSWERRVKDISALCGGLADVLEKAGNDQLRTDEAIKAEIAELRVGSEDVAAADGSGSR
ncbi:hypothetical protein [Streptomyces mexicanus]|uniref:hypothetical protein n=1 Tax=Streptomyces mexicanus TaxID=178566 RepID=UPI0036976A77